MVTLTSTKTISESKRMAFVLESRAGLHWILMDHARLVQTHSTKIAVFRA